MFLCGLHGIFKTGIGAQNGMHNQLRWLCLQGNILVNKFIKSRKTSFNSPMGRAVSTASVIGLHMVVAVFIGLGAGLFLDKTFNTAPWLTIIFLLVGIIAGFKNMISQATRLMAIQEQMDKEQQAEELKASLELLHSIGQRNVNSGNKNNQSSPVSSIAKNKENKHGT